MKTIPLSILVIIATLNCAMAEKRPELIPDGIDVVKDDSDYDDVEPLALADPDYVPFDVTFVVRHGVTDPKLAAPAVMTVYGIVTYEIDGKEERRSVRCGTIDSLGAGKSFQELRKYAMPKGAKVKSVEIPIPEYSTAVRFNFTTDRRYDAKYNEIIVTFK